MPRLLYIATHGPNDPTKACMPFHLAVNGAAEAGIEVEVNLAGDAAVLVDPYDAVDIKDGIKRVLTDPALAAEMRRKGLLRAREFSWERSVARTLEIYRETAGA